MTYFVEWDCNVCGAYCCGDAADPPFCSMECYDRYYETDYREREQARGVQPDRVHDPEC